MNEEVKTEVDEYGNPFPPHSQMYHWQHVKATLERMELESKLVTPPPEQCEWKEKPAGYYDKSPKNSGSLDG